MFGTVQPSTAGLQIEQELSMMMRASAPSIGHGRVERRQIRAGFARIFGFVEYCFRVYGERQRLRALDPQRLKDLGLSQGMVESEARRSFLDVPADRPDARW